MCVKLNHPLPYSYLIDGRPRLLPPGAHAATGSPLGVGEAWGAAAFDGGRVEGHPGCVWMRAVDDELTRPVHFSAHTLSLYHMLYTYMHTGIGPYSAGAVASIAHGTRAGMVDGNVQR